MIPPAPDGASGQADPSSLTNIAGGPLRIILHDYGCYPFTRQLARELAAAGHRVLYLYAIGVRDLKRPIEGRSGDSTRLTLIGIQIEGSRTSSLWRRLLGERRYGRPLARHIAAFGPDVVVSTNAPLIVQAVALREANRVGAAFIFWLQDVHSVAIDRLLRRRLSLLGGFIGSIISQFERGLLQRSQAVVAISEGFLPLLRRSHIPDGRISVISNWAPLDEVQPLPRTNPWAAEHDLTEALVLLYAGTLGFKHDPAKLLALARALPDTRVVIISEGSGANWLRRRGASTPNLRVLPFQAHSRFSEVLASADVLLAILEPEAGEYSVPSKVLTYLTAGRPILAAISPDNPAATLLTQAGAGKVVSPSDPDALVAAARAFLADPEARMAAGLAGRAYAEASFEIGPIADRFETIVRGLTQQADRTEFAPPSDTSKSFQRS